nr:hypothetical protein [Azospirillum sp. 412522]
MENDRLLERFAAFHRRTEDSVEIAAARDLVTGIWRHPRDAAVAFRYHRDTLPSGRYWIAGAGPQGIDLVRALEVRTDIGILGFVDRKAHLYDGYCGLPVVPADKAADGRIIVANRVWEQDILDDMTGSGIAGDRLVPTYTAAAFDALAPSDPVDLPDLQSIRTLIVRDTSQVSLIPEATLRHVFPADDTLVVYTSSHPAETPSPWYRSHDAALSVTRVLRLIHRLQPQTVVLATMPHFNDWVLPLCPPDRTWRFVFEPNDMTLVYGDTLRELVPISPRHLDRCRLAEAWALRHADMTVTNCQGPHWDTLLTAVRGRAHPFFSGPELAASDPPSAPGREPLRILYAGGIPQNYLRAAWQTDYRFLPLLAALALRDDIAVDIFNAYHTQPGHDACYADLTALAGGRLGYFRARPFPEILQAAHYDFGWLHRGDIPRRRPGEAGAGNDVLVLNKRFTAYAAASLPIVIDDQLDAMAELVERFGAGLVLPAGPLDAGDVARRLQAADPAALSSGVRRLHAHLASANASTLASLRIFTHGG